MVSSGPVIALRFRSWCSNKAPMSAGALRYDLLVYLRESKHCRASQWHCGILAGCQSHQSKPSAHRSSISTIIEKSDNVVHRYGRVVAWCVISRTASSGRSVATIDA